MNLNLMGKLNWKVAKQDKPLWVYIIKFNYLQEDPFLDQIQTFLE